jgi:hypothetical protein
MTVDPSLIGGFLIKTESKSNWFHNQKPITTISKTFGFCVRNLIINNFFINFLFKKIIQW